MDNEKDEDRAEDAALLSPVSAGNGGTTGVLRAQHKEVISKSKEDEANEKDEEEEDGDTSFRGIFAQSLVALAVCLLTCGCGFPIGYSAILLPQLQAANSTLPTDQEMGSWIASVHSAATPIGALLSGYIADRWGRREALRLSVLPFTIGFGLISLANSHWLILLGRIFAGLCVGLSAVPCQVMLGEIAEPKLRGILAGSFFVSYSLGMLIVYALGSVLDWHTVAGLAVILPLASLVAFTVLPESPVWLARNNRVDEARRAMYWLRGGPNSRAKREYNQLIARIEDDRLHAANPSTPPSTCLSTFSQSHVLKPFAIVIGFHFLQIVTGTFLVIIYAVDIIKGASDDDEGIDSFFAAVLTGVSRFVFTIIASGLLFCCNRRTLAVVSSIFSGVTAIGVGTILYLGSLPPPHYFTRDVADALLLGFLLAYIASNTSGYFVLPGVTIGEFLPAQVRGMAGGYIFTAFNIGLFATAKLYPWFTANLGSHGIFWVFGGSSLVGSVFFFVFMPETRGRTLNEIEDYFKQDNIMWLTRKKIRSEFIL